VEAEKTKKKTNFVGVFLFSHFFLISEEKNQNEEQKKSNQNFFVLF
jgi:hypothetical protein